jgi:nitrogen-specific signal transduction histidine kinase
VSRMTTPHDLSIAGSRLQEFLTALAHSPDISVAAGVVAELMGALPWPLLVTADSGELVAVSPAAAALLGGNSEALVGHLLTEELDMLPSEALRPGVFLAQRRQADGTVLAVELEVRPCTLRTGSTLLVIAVRDLTQEQHLLEERLRTAELEGIFRIIATVNHKINNPLFGLMATLQLLTDELGTPSLPVQRKLARMQECCERIKQITDDLSRVIRPARRSYAAGEGMVDLARAMSEIGDIDGGQECLSGDDR